MPPTIEPLRHRAPIDPEIASLPEVEAGWIYASGGLRTYVLESGPRASTELPLVLVHGLGTNGVVDFYPVLPALCRDRRVIAIDLPGLGRSELGREQPGPDVFVERVSNVLAERAPRGFDLLGHSLGAVVALMVAAQRPDAVHHLILVDAAGVLHREAFVGNQIQRALDPVSRGAPRAGHLLEGAGKAVLSMLRLLEPSDLPLTEGAVALPGPQAQAALALIEVNAGPYLDAVRAPTLILWGELDPIAPLRTARLLQTRIQNAHLVVFPGVGHVPMSEAADDMISRVETFIEARDTSPSPAIVDQGTTTTNAVLTCDAQHDLVVEGGRYRNVLLRDCQRISVRGVHAERIAVERSSGVIEGAVLSQGMTASDSDLTITAGRFEGEVALTVGNSRIDIAGTRLHGSRAAILTTAPSRVLMSVVDLRSPLTRQSGHGEVHLGQGQGF